MIALSAPVQLTALVSPAAADTQSAGDRFWETLLSGNDRIYAPEAGRSFLFGDFLQITASQLVQESKTGGNDIITAAPTSGDSTLVIIGSRGSVGSALVGDAYSVSGFVFDNIAYSGTLHGGDDTITLTNRAAYNLIGDAYTVGQLGNVIGGNDIIRSDAITKVVGFGAVSILVGDVFDNGGYVTGGDDSIRGSNFAFLDEVISGDVWSQFGTTKGGDDDVWGRSGHDFIAGDVVAAAGNVTGGKDTLYGGGDADIIAGDVLQAGNNGPFDTIGGGNALPVVIQGGNDILRGEAGDDILAGDIYSVGDLTPADSSASGGNDRLYGGDGDDTLYGDYGENPGGAPAAFFDDGGDDLLVGGAGADALFGGTGTDTASYADAPGGVVASLANPSINAGDAAGDTYDSIENLTGSDFDDTLNGSSSGNSIDGGKGYDTIKGYGGNDTLTGWAGQDIFVFNTALDAAANVDTITDFNGAADTIQLDNAVFTALTATGTLAASAFKDIADGPKDANDRIIYNSVTGNLYYDADGSAAAFTQVKFANIATLAAISNADFNVI